MNLTDDQAAIYLSTVSSAYFYGGVAGALAVKQIAHFNTQKLWRTVVTASIFVNIAFQYENMYTMAICRFFLGMLSRMIAISNYWWIYQTSLPRQKSRIVSFPLLCYSCTNILVYIASIYDDGSWYYWRLIAGFPIILGTILVIMDFLIIRKMNSIKYWIKTMGLVKTKARAYTIYNKPTADMICEDFYQVAKLEGPVPGEDNGEEAGQD